MPVFPIQITFTLALIFGVGVGLLGMKKFWGDMKEANGVTSGDLKGSIIAMVTELLSHNKFKDCDVSKDRYTSHLLVFYSFIALGIATGLGVVYIDFLHLESPFRFGYGTPIKIFGLAGAIAIIAGTFLMMSNRFKNAEKAGLGSYFDWLLIGLIATIGISGALSWITRVAGIAGLAYPIYFIHLVVVFSLFVYLPFSKLAHMFYRGAALTFNRYSGREDAAVAIQVEAQPAAEAEIAATESEAPKAEEKAE
jgi:quinone-modifying oxidoreductase subunit QmoC